jgi:hypothetical protein
VLLLTLGASRIEIARIKRRGVFDLRLYTPEYYEPG